MKYAGIGSRKVAPKVLMKMINLGEYFAKKGLILRSGGAIGSDGAFELGASYVPNSKAEIWLPFPTYSNTNPNDSKYFYPGDCHFNLMEKYHPIGNKLKDLPRKLHARNMGQILGVDLKDPVSFVVCWTPDGCDSILSYSKDTGGTGTAICCASDHKIPVFNMNTLDFKESFTKFISDTL